MAEEKETLFDMTGRLNLLVALADSIEPEDEETFADTLEAVKGEIGTKLDSYKYSMDQVQARRDLLKRIADEATKKAKSCDRALDRMKQVAFQAVSEVPPDSKGRKYIRGDVYKFSIQKNGGKRPLVIDGEVPDNYKIVSFQNNTDKIRTELESGKELGFAHLGDTGYGLRIK